MMAGMLVPVEDLYDEPVDKSMRAIETLFGVDPEFVTLCKTLFGSDVDPVEVWNTAFGKNNPTGPDMSTPADLNSHRNRRRALEAAGIGATVIGGALGVGELRREAPKAVKELRSKSGYVRRSAKGKLVPGSVARTAGVGAMLAGDAIATGNQVSSARRRQAVAGPKAARYSDVEKISVGALADGLEHGMRKLPGMGGLAPKVGNKVRQAGAHMTSFRSGIGDANRGTGNIQAAGSRSYRGGQRVQGMAQRATSTPMRTVGTAATAGVSGGILANRHMNKRADDLDVVWAGEFSKFDEDKRLVFGWASVVELNGSPVVDRQGDYIHPDDLENASYEYVIKSRVGGDMHSRDGEIPLKVSDLVESMVFTPEKIAKMGLPDAVKERIPTGWWVGFKVHSDKHWDLVKKNARTGFSIHGRGKRVPTSMDELMPGYH